METTIVKEENRAFFEPLMPAEQWREADLILGAVEDGTACGVLAVREKYTFIELRYLYVAEEYRRKGIAAGLLRELHDMGIAARMDGELCQYVDNEEMKALDACLARCRYDKDLEESTVYVTSLADLSDHFFGKQGFDKKTGAPMAAGGAAFSPGVRAVPLSEVTARVWNGFLERLEELPNEDGCVPELEIKYMYDQESSFLLMKRGEPEGCILFERSGEDYILSYFCILRRVIPQEMMGLFLASYRVLSRSCAPGDKIYINALTEASRKLILQLTDQKAGIVGQAVCRYYLY